MADVSALALEVTLSTHDSDIKTFIGALNDLAQSDILSDATPFAGANIGAILSEIQNGTYGLSALNTDLDKLLTGIIQGTGTVLPANKSLYDILWVDRYTKSSGSFTFPSGDTTEKDISAISGGPDLTGTKIRRYWVKLDMTGPAGDASAWTTCTIKIKEKIDGTNYRTLSKAVKARADLAATAEPGIPIESLPTDVDLVITVQFDVALTSAQTIYWRWVCEKMEY